MLTYIQIFFKWRLNTFVAITQVNQFNFVLNRLEGYEISGFIEVLFLPEINACRVITDLSILYWQLCTWYNLKWHPPVTLDLRFFEAHFLNPFSGILCFIIYCY